MNPSPCTVIVVAAGSGKRCGGELPKQFQLLNGVPVVFHSIRVFQEHPLVERILPVVAPERIAEWGALAAAHPQYAKLMPPVAGGAERQQSVANALERLREHPPEWVAIHDAARPLVTRQVLDRLLAARSDYSALIAAIPAADTVKLADAARRVVATPERGQVWLAQTPQLFDYRLLLKAHHAALVAGVLGTDDAALVERLGVAVGLVEGDPSNLKITRPSDLVVAAALINLASQLQNGVLAPDPSSGRF